MSQNAEKDKYKPYIKILEVTHMAILENFEPKMCFTILRKSVVFHMVQEIQKQISDYLVNFAKEHDLKYVQDDMNNVVIYKPATPGYENAPTVILPGTYGYGLCEMPGNRTWFLKDGLKLVVKDGFFISRGHYSWRRWRNCSGLWPCAALDSTDLPHPALEVVFTVDEETGLLGADGSDCSLWREEEWSIWILKKRAVRG